MIKFFKQIRRNLLKDGKTGKYLKYAIGEIVLVMIGILLALQVNNWNEGRKRLQTEKHYLNELKIEFTNNFNEVNRVMGKNQLNLDNALKIANHETSDSTILSNSEFNRLLFYAILGEIQYRPSPGVLNGLLNAGKLEVIRNKALRSKLSSWDGILLKVRFQEEEHSILRYKLLNIVYAKGNFRNGFSDTDYINYGLKPGNTNNSNFELLNNQEFDNLISTFYLTGKYLNEYYYKELKLSIEETLNLIETELHH
ncbi:DUF6090 family protein [Hanstruepera marina]|uniref:DUF6090 family protein n=1 Tax=Hanstruepera marina TaxID=2873265 RepID=UPI001CA71E82|nr:DUF6090 family protein [Hanstruepera marina]